jgi:hypothetical protein
MEPNPYEPPIVAAPTLADEQDFGGQGPARPRGIWILAGLHLLVGLLFAAATLLYLRGAFDVVTGEGQSRVPWPFLTVVLLCTFISACALSTSIGLWLGARWGWWLTAFYYVWGVLGSVTDVLFGIWYLEERNFESIAWFLPGHLILLGIHSLILVYLCKKTVRHFFRLQSLRMSRALALLAIIAIVVLAATIAARYL